MVVQSPLRQGLFEAYRRIRPNDRRLWALAFCFGTFLGGIVWGISGLWLMDPGRFDHQLLVIMVILALVYAALSARASW